MNGRLDYFYFFILDTALLLAALGVWFTAIMPGPDRWSWRFFLAYFIVLILCCVSAFMEIVIAFRPFPNAAIMPVLFLECLFLVQPDPVRPDRAGSAPSA